MWEETQYGGLNCARSVGAALFSALVLSSACTSDSGAHTEVAVDGGDGRKAGTGGAPAGSGGAPVGAGGAQASAGGAPAASGGAKGGSGGVHQGGSAGLHSGGTGGGVVDSGLDGSACGSKKDMCCCAGDVSAEPVCRDAGWTCEGEGFLAFYGDDCTRRDGPCWLPGKPDGLCPFLASLGTDVSGLLQPATVAKQAPTTVRSLRLDGTLALDGQLGSTSQRFPAPLDASTGCRSTQSTRPTDFYAIELVGPGPHQLEIDACQSGLLIINAYQAKDGTPGAVDAMAECAHFVASTGMYCGNGYRFVGSGFAAGTLVLTVSTIDPTASYHVELRSSTSCSGPKPVPPVEGDAATTPFVDPNPRACTAQNLGQCNYTTYDPSGGSIKWSPCCRTDFPQNPEGKCGVTGNGGPCVERMAPGNLDSSCPSGEFRVSSFPPYNIVDKGQGCCNWRTGKCGLFADTIDLGCVAIPIEASQSMPSCTPDYSNGLAL